MVERSNHRLELPRQRACLPIHEPQPIRVKQLSQDVRRRALGWGGGSQARLHQSCHGLPSSTRSGSLKATLGSQQTQDQALASIFENALPPDGSPVVEMDVDLGGRNLSIALALYAEEAPKHVENFLKLVGEGYYDGTKFHRIIAGFMIQGGDPNTKDPAKGIETWGQGGPEYKIEPELGDLVHARYVLSAAKGNEPQSSGSQFFITTGAPHHLDGIHTVFGAVIEGHAAVDELSGVSIRPGQGQQQSVPEAPVPTITAARVRQ